MGAKGKSKSRRPKSAADAEKPSALPRVALAVCVVCGLGTLGLRRLRLGGGGGDRGADPGVDRLTVRETVARRTRRVACASGSACGARSCDRVVVDDFLSDDEVDALRAIAQIGMEAAAADADAGGPTIFDINSGFTMAPGARLANVYGRDGESGPPLFAKADFELYRSVITRLKAEVEAVAKAESPLYFTAPTFLTRLSGKNATWVPAEDHDVYWTMHVDRDNTDHYEYSGLLYLSDYGTDFGGGLFTFEDGAAVEPKRGRLSMFASGPENRHQVQPVTAGERLTLSFWFACDAAYEFADFLDGKAHFKYREPGPRGDL